MKAFSAVLLPGVLAAVLIANSAVAAVPPDTERVAEAAFQEAETMTRADHHPLTADYYTAGKLYNQAANGYEMMKADMLQGKTVQAANLSVDDQQKVIKMTRRIQELRFLSEQMKRVANNRESRGLL